MQTRSRLSGWLALAVFATVGGGMLAADPAFAKVDVDKLTVGGEIRVRYEYRENASFGGRTGGVSNSNESAASHRVRVSVGYDLTPDVSFFAQLQDARVWGGESAAGAGTGIGAVSSANLGGTGVDLHQGYIQVKNVLVPGLSAKLGRQEIIFGDHRLFGNFGWSQIGNSFDAVRLTHSAAWADLDLFWARITDTDGGAAASTAGVLFPGTGSKGTTDQDVYGAYLTLKLVKNWTIEPYYFLLKDSRTQLASVAAVSATPQAPDQVRNTLGTRINGKAGGLDATLEGAYQFGGVSSNPTGEHNLHIASGAVAGKAGYTFEPVPMKPRIGFEFDWARGDSCVNKAGAASCQALGHLNTFDNLYPTNHFHYGYMDLMAWKNMVNYQFMFDVKPSPVSKLQANFIWHRLANQGDNWYRAGQGIYGLTGAANTATSIGRELDLHYWHTFKEKFKFEIGYGHFWAGDYIKRAATLGNVINGAGTPVNSDSGQNWGYVMTSILF